MHEAKKKRVPDMTPMKLIKLAYISHGFHLACLEMPLFNDAVRAWQYGPVVERVYEAVKHYGKDIIFFNHFDHVQGEITGPSKKVIEAVVKVYGKKYNALELSHLTHRKDTPWDKTIDKTVGWRRRWLPAMREVIDNNTIKAYYRQKIGDDENQ